MSTVNIYGLGVCYASVCAPDSMEPDEVERAVNEEIDRLTGDTSELRWGISDDQHFATGETNPCACGTDPHRKHWLLSC